MKNIKGKIKSFILRKILKYDNERIIGMFVNKHRNDLVLTDNLDVVKLIGWTDVYDDDNYYVVLNKNEIQLHSCVGRLIPLKKRLTKFEYDLNNEIFNLNYPIKGIHYGQTVY